jgi:hypothetical protein
MKKTSIYSFSFKIFGHHWTKHFWPIYVGSKAQVNMKWELRMPSTFDWISCWLDYCSVLSASKALDYCAESRRQSSLLSYLGAGLIIAFRSKGAKK